MLVLREALPDGAESGVRFVKLSRDVTHAPPEIEDRHFYGGKTVQSTSQQAIQKRRWRSTGSNRQKERERENAQNQRKLQAESPEERRRRLEEKRRKRRERTELQDHQRTLMPICKRGRGRTPNVRMNQCNGKYTVSTKVRNVQIREHTHRFLDIEPSSAADRNPCDRIIGIEYVRSKPRDIVPVFELD